MSKKRSEAQPILDRRDPGVHLPEHVSAQTVRYAETWRSNSRELQASMKAANVLMAREKGWRGRPVAAAKDPRVGTPVERAAIQAQSAREMASRDRSLRIRRALESGPIARLVSNGAMSADKAYELATALEAAGRLPGMSDHTGSARK